MRNIPQGAFPADTQIKQNESVNSNPQKMRIFIMHFLKISNQSSLNVLVFITIKLVLVNSLNINMKFKFNSIEIIIWQLINILKLRNITCPFQAKIFYNEKCFREGIKGFVWVFFNDGRGKKEFLQIVRMFPFFLCLKDIFRYFCMKCL